MTTDVQSFSPHLFNHYVGLERLMNGKEAITPIEAAAKDPKFIDAPSTYKRYFGRWQIVWITIKYPFELIASVFFKALSVVLGYLTFLKTARVLSVLSRQMTRDWEQLLVQWDYNYADEKNEASQSLSPLLMPAFNAHQTTSWDLYTLGSLPNSFLTEPRVISMTHRAVNYQLGVKEAMKVFYRNLKEKKDERTDSWGVSPKPLSKEVKNLILKNFSEKYALSPKDALQFLQAAFPEKETGKAIQKLYSLLKQMDIYLEQNCDAIRLLSPQLCKGASLWFINLYLKTEAKFQDPLKHLLSVAEQFKNGVPKQGALLQSLANTDQLLKIKKTDLKELYTSLYELDCNRDSARAKIEKSLNDGVYRLGVLNHSLVYIKKNGSGYLWDPNIGLLATTEKQMFDLILKNYYKPGDRDSHIYFEQYKLT